MLLKSVNQTVRTPHDYFLIVYLEDVVDIKKQQQHRFTLYQKSCFRGASIKGKLTEIYVMNAKETILKKKSRPIHFSFQSGWIQF